MKKIVLFTTLYFISTAIFSQSFQVPKNYKFETKEDYSKYNHQIHVAIDWALSTPLSQESEKRMETNAFVMAWLTGTPEVSIIIDENATPFFKINPDLLMPFMMGWAKYSLASKSKDKLLGFKAGAEAAVAFYLKNKKVLKKDKEIEKFAKLIEEGKLEEQLRTKMDSQIIINNE